MNKNLFEKGETSSMQGTPVQNQLLQADDIIEATMLDTVHNVHANPKSKFSRQSNDARSMLALVEKGGVVHNQLISMEKKGPQAISESSLLQHNNPIPIKENDEARFEPNGKAPMNVQGFNPRQSNDEI